MGCLLAARRFAALALELAALALALALIAPAALGYSRYVITGASMTGTYDRGSVAFAKEVPVNSLEVGDVITYQPPGKDGLVTHRIVRIGHNRAGVPVFRTKGDANEAVDPWTFKLDHSTQPRVEFAIPYIGYPIAALAIRWVRIALVGLPALLIAAFLALRLWRESESPPAPPRPAGNPR